MRVYTNLVYTNLVYTNLVYTNLVYTIWITQYRKVSIMIFKDSPVKKYIDLIDKYIKEFFSGSQ